jgi:nicotinate-nucleotide adenylyltransferase
LTQAPARVGMFGGAFDPPHRGHAALARIAVDQLKLDRLLVMPTGDAWHKSRSLTPAVHRLAMARLAFEDATGRTVVDDREILRPGPTYTIYTLQELRSEHPGAQLYLVLGEDQAADFTRWRDWNTVARLAILCVAARGGSAASAGIDALRALPGVRVEVLALPRIDVSATDIRARLTAGQDISELVAPAVASYIARHHPYPIP